MSYGRSRDLHERPPNGSPRRDADTAAAPLPRARDLWYSHAFADGAHLVGREGELATLRDFLAGDSRAERSC